MEEIVELRNLNSKHFSNENGTRTMNAHVGHIHYQDGKKFEKINTTLERVSDGWIQTKASYHQFLPLYADGDIVFNDRFHTNREIIFTPVAKHIQGILLDNADGWIQKRVRYANAFGTGIHLECTVGNISFKKEVVIDADPGVNVEVAFKIEVSGNPLGLICVEGQPIPSFHGVDMLGKIVVFGRDIDNRDELTYWRPMMAWDANGNRIGIPIRFEMRGRDLYLIKTIPASFLASAVYPVRSDTTTSYYVGAGDGHILNWLPEMTQAVWNTLHDATTGLAAYPTGLEAFCYCYMKGDYNPDGAIHMTRSFFPVNTSGIPDSATIISAYFAGYITVIYDDYPSDGRSYVAMVQTTQNDPTTLIKADYNQCGAVNNPPKGTANYDLGSLNTGQFNNYTLNVTGRGWIKKTAGDPWTMLGLREGHDIQDVKPADPGGSVKATGIGSTRTSESVNPPYLSVTYEEVGVFSLLFHDRRAFRGIGRGVF